MSARFKERSSPAQILPHPTVLSAIHVLAIPLAVPSLTAVVQPSEDSDDVMLLEVELVSPLDLDRMRIVYDQKDGSRSSADTT